MKESGSITGNFLKIDKDDWAKYEDYQVLVGFSGFGNVGYLALTHIVETVENLETIAMWGNSSWYHKGRLESLLTVYAHHVSKTLILLPRIPVHVATVPQDYWNTLALEVLSWNCKKYIVIGGLREDTRSPDSLDWAAYVPTSQWTKQYSQQRTLMDHLPMIGPLSSFVIYGTSLNLPVLGLLAYCNFEEDEEASLVALNEIEKMCDLTIPLKSHLEKFDYNFVPLSPFNRITPDQTSNESDDDDDDNNDDFGYDIRDLV